MEFLASSDRDNSCGKGKTGFAKKMLEFMVVEVGI